MITTMRHILWILFGLSLFNQHAYGFEPSITLTKSQTGPWTVDYHLTEPIQRMVFVSSTDDSRSARWHPVDSNFEFVFESAKNVQSVQRKDGKAFQQVRFSMTPSYVRLPKDYAPFSPFSDGSIAWHTGRFTVCIEPCQRPYQQHFRMQALPTDHIVLPGLHTLAQARWSESSDQGQIVYVGSLQDAQLPVTQIIDPGLPQALSEQLNKQLPLANTYFAGKLGKLPSAPMVLASYGQTTSENYGNQGGVLGDQLFVHWYGNKLQDLIEMDDDFVADTVWFFAHEVAHSYQRGVDIEDAAWIHEGMADWMAADYMRHSSRYQGYVARRLVAANQQCLNKQTSKYRRQYACGMWLLLQIEQQHGSLYAIWSDFAASQNAGQISEQDFWRSVAKFTDETTSKKWQVQLSQRLQASQR